MYALAERVLVRVPERYQVVVRQFIKFAITGTIGAVVDFGTYGIITRGIGWDFLYTVFGRTISTANNISVFLAIISNFIINKYWTFRYREGNVLGQGVSYFVFNFFTWMINQLLVSYFAFDLIVFNQVFGENKDLAAKVAAIGFIMILNFLGTKLLVFRKA